MLPSKNFQHNMYPSIAIMIFINKGDKLPFQIIPKLKEKSQVITKNKFTLAGEATFQEQLPSQTQQSSVLITDIR